MLRGEPLPRGVFDRCVGTPAREVLVDAGLATDEGGQVSLAVTVIDAGSVLAVIPKFPWGDQVVYLGPDSAHLIEAALRLAPRGERAADLGTGTGLLAALLAQRYSSVVATDIHASVTGAAALTFALNHEPPGHRVGACVADVASGLRPGVFDLVAANAPWVPLAVEFDDPREPFAHGGETGVELPARFLVEGAQLLAAGGIGITMALDASFRSDAPWSSRPLVDACDRLKRDGYYVELVPTPFNRERPQLAEIMRRRQPFLDGAEHVAVIVRRPRPGGSGSNALHVAVDALRRRWEQREVVPDLTP